MTTHQQDTPWKGWTRSGDDRHYVLAGPGGVSICHSANGWGHAAQANPNRKSYRPFTADPGTGEGILLTSSGHPRTFTTIDAAKSALERHLGHSVTY